MIIKTNNGLFDMQSVIVEPHWNHADQTVITPMGGEVASYVIDMPYEKVCDKILDAAEAGCKWCRIN